MSHPERPLALVTGASRGIGSAIAAHLAPSHDLVLTARNAEALTETAEWLSETTQVTTIAADLSTLTGRATLLAGLEWLDPPVQVLVNNAGIAGSAPLHRTDDAIWNQTLTLNLTAPFELSRSLAPVMAKRGWGRIINIASTAGLKGYGFTTAYSASKAGLIGLTRAMAAELSTRGVTVNAVCPGFTDTDIVADAIRTIAEKTDRDADQARESLEGFSPLGRLVTPEEVAALVAYLASEAAAAVNGQALAIDGGETTL